jgi:hypothetical protein|tara:strand:+ start:8405 stop:8638 length:234 start_codon:yes stop_codon:yes gene_type:complete
MGFKELKEIAELKGGKSEENNANRARGNQIGASSIDATDCCGDTGPSGNDEKHYRVVQWERASDSGMGCGEGYDRRE